MNLITPEALDYRISVLKEELSSEAGTLLSEHPIEVYLRIVESYPETNHYREIDARLIRTFEEIKVRLGDHTLALYHKLALLLFIKKLMSLLD